MGGDAGRGSCEPSVAAFAVEVRSTPRAFLMLGVVAVIPGPCSAIIAVHNLSGLCDPRMRARYGFELFIIRYRTSPPKLSTS